MAQGYEMLIYQLKIEILPYKPDEFVNNICSFSRRIRKQKGCLGYNIYQDSEKKNTYSLFGKWKTRQAI